MTEQPLSIPYPWQQSHWESFLQQVSQERLAHGFLLAGPEGLGKAHYADAMANYLLCQHPRSDLPCGECRACQLNLAQTNPDKITIVPESAGKQIKIDQIRAIGQFVSSTAQQGGSKVVIIGPVEHLNLNAANALLKNLEEPTAETFFILYSHVSSGVIATIRSRCQFISMSLPPSNNTSRWLVDLGLNRDISLAMMMNADAPIASRKLLEDDEKMGQLHNFIECLSTIKSNANTQVADITAVKDWLEIELNTFLAWWIQLIYQSIRQEALSEQGKGALSESLAVLFDTIANANRQWLFRFIDKLLIAKKHYLQGANNNKQLLLEELLLDWCAIMKSAN